MRHATKRISVNSPYAKTIEANCTCAGPHPNITGMKKLYWGTDAYCVRIGSYVYKVTKKLYESCK